jgi:hypothetical protein
MQWPHQESNPRPPACSIVPKPITLPGAPASPEGLSINYAHLGKKRIRRTIIVTKARQLTVLWASPFQSILPQFAGPILKLYLNIAVYTLIASPSVELHVQSIVFFIYTYIGLLTALGPTDGVSTLLWWWGLSAPETLRAMPTVA